jgi:hypothetical protein
MDGGCVGEYKSGVGWAEVGCKVGGNNCSESGQFKPSLEEASAVFSNHWTFTVLLQAT